MVVMNRSYFILVVIVLHSEIIGDAFAVYVWSPWTPCSASCGKGFQFRRRVCEKTNSPSCKKNTLDVKQCYKACKHKKYTTPSTQQLIDDENTYILNKNLAFLKSMLKPKWSKWSSCSKKCGNGIQIRRRSCVVPPETAKGMCNFKRIDLRLCVGQNRKCTNMLYETSENREHSDPEVLSRQKSHLYVEYVMLIMMAGVCVGLLFILQLICRQGKKCTTEKPK